MKRGIIFGLVIALSMFMMGCQKDNRDVIRFATWDTETTLEIQKEIAKLFEERHGNVRVQVEGYGDGYDQKMAAGFGAGNAPDVMYMWDFPSYELSLEPLNTYINTDESFKDALADLYPGLLNYSTIGDNILGLPVGYTSHVIYYNKALFDQAGIDYPAHDWTWEDLREKADAISKLGDDIYGFAFSTQPDPYDFEQYFWSFGSAYLSPDGSQMDGYFNSPDAIYMMTFFSDMVRDGQALGAQDSISKAFRGGNIGMQESGIWPLNRHMEAIGAENLGIAPLPKAKSAASVINSSALCMAKNAKNKDLAWEFIKFYTTDPEAVAMRAKVDLPVLKSVAKELDYVSDPYYEPFYKMLETAEAHTPAFLLNKNYSRISEEISFAIEKIFVDTINGQAIDVKAILDKAVEDSATYFNK